MKMRLDICEDNSDAAQIVTALALDRHASMRAFLLARRVADLMQNESTPEARFGIVGEVARASETMEHLLIVNPGEDIRMPMFLERFVGLRAVVSGGGVFRVSASDLTVDFELARSVAYIICDLIGLIENMSTSAGPDVRIAVEPDEDILMIAISADGVADAPVSTLSGSRTLKRAEGFIHSIGGSMARGIRDGEMLFGISLPVAHA